MPYSTTNLQLLEDIFILSFTMYIIACQLHSTSFDFGVLIDYLYNVKALIPYLSQYCTLGLTY